MQETRAMTEKSEKGTAGSVSQQDGQATSSSEIYIDPVMERRIVTKFDWLVLPQFVIIIILG